MKTIINNRLISGFICMFLLLMIGTHAFAGDKVKPRIGVDYIKVMNDKSYISIEVKYKPEKRWVLAEDLDLKIYKNFSDDSLIYLGNTTTDNNGVALYEIESNQIQADSIVTFKYTVAIEDNEILKDAEKVVKFKDANIEAKAVEVDSVHHISILFTDANGDPIADKSVDLGLQRLFAPLKIGSYDTDENGEVLVAIENPLPGVDGVLTFEIIHDSRSYGKVKKILDANIGETIVDKSTFDKRTMWSPASKTPIFMLIFPNLLIFGIWATIALLVFNIYRIYKAKE